MIKGLWENVTLYCNHRHETPVEMVVEQGPKTVFYACPKYHEYNREEGEKACANFLYLNEYEKMLTKISSLFEEADKEGEILNLTNYKWTENGVDFEIFEHKKINGKDKIKVKMVNRKTFIK